MRCNRRLAIPVVVLGLIFALHPLASAQPDEAFAELYAQHSMNMPTADLMTVCYAFVCRQRIELEFTDSDRRKVAAIFAKAKASAAAERKAVANAVSWFDRRVGPMAGTDHRVARADIRTLDPSHNFDCIDTSTNTTSLLLVLAEWGLLHYHYVGLPRYRGNFLVGQLSHNTAVLIERQTRKAWSVDMWTTNYGDPAEIMTLDRWMEEK